MSTRMPGKLERPLVILRNVSGSLFVKGDYIGRLARWIIKGCDK